MFVSELHRDSPTREAEPVNENTIAGYRTIRSLKENAESQTILVRASAHAGEEALAELKTVKRFEAGAAVSRILSEIECGVRIGTVNTCEQFCRVKMTQYVKQGVWVECTLSENFLQFRFFALCDGIAADEC